VPLTSLFLFLAFVANPRTQEDSSGPALAPAFLRRLVASQVHSSCDFRVTVPSYLRTVQVNTWLSYSSMTYKLAFSELAEPGRLLLFLVFSPLPPEGHFHQREVWPEVVHMGLIWNSCKQPKRCKKLLAFIWMKIRIGLRNWSAGISTGCLILRFGPTAIGWQRLKGGLTTSAGNWTVQPVGPTD